MADFCSFCETCRPVGGTRILVLNDGALWAEFCPQCADYPLTNALTGETVAVGQLFARASGDMDTVITPRVLPSVADDEARDWGGRDGRQEVREEVSDVEAMEDYILRRIERTYCMNGLLTVGGVA